MNATLTLTEERIGTISPRLHGHFAEHLGRCCYDGLWSGDGALKPGVIDALKRIGVPLLRWPGGCFADLYHWRDGIGPADTRPRRYSESCGERVVDTNRIGTHEFMALCEAVGAEPYLAGNLGSGTVQEMCDWVEYCNGSLDTTLVRERAANGHPAPMAVRYWGIGNESWGCGGNYDPVTYAQEYRRAATLVNRVDPVAQLVLVGDNRGRRDWNLRVLETLQNHLGLVHHLSIHRYWGSGPAQGTDEDAYYRLQAGPQQVEADIREAALVIEYITRGRHKIGIAFDEWGIWHPEARVESRYEAPSTLRDALAAAATFAVFHENCDTVSMANIAQIANVLQPLIVTQGDSVQVTPTGEVFALLARHRDATALRTHIDDCPERTIPAYRGDPDWRETFPEGRLAYLAASVSRRREARTITLINRHRTEPLEVTLRGLPVHGVPATLRVLSARTPEATAAQVTTQTIALGPTAILPPASVTSIEVG
jgi:alpha-N-arabinofuranosidase